MKHLYGCPYFPNHDKTTTIHYDPYFCACAKAQEQFAREDSAAALAKATNTPDPTFSFTQPD